MSERSVVFMFSGLGSQYFQMGRAFFDGNITFRNTLLQLDAVAAPLLGRSMVDVLYHDDRKKDETFDSIELTSTAIFMVEYALAKTLIDSGIRPDYLLAVSMGTYAAASIASVLDPREVIQVLVKQAKIYEERCPKGSMIAVLSNQALYRQLNNLVEKSEIAAINFDNHFVISAPDEHLDAISQTLARANVAFQKLAVPFPFHAHWMDGARDAALAALGTLRFQRPSIPLVCCASGGVLETVTPEAIWSTVREPIQFERTIAMLEKRGPHDYVDAGPAGTLATTLKYALPSGSTSKGYPIMSPFSQELVNYQRLAAERAPFNDPPRHHQHVSRA